MQFTLVSKVIVGFAALMGLQLLMSLSSGVGLGRLSGQFNEVTENLLPLLQVKERVSSAALTASRSVSQHAAETEAHRLRPLEEKFTSSVRDYRRSVEELQGLVIARPELKTALLNVARSMESAFVLSSEHQENHRRLLRIEALSHSALEEFEHSWQYFDVDIKDTKFMLSDKALVGKWVLESLVKDANALAKILQRVPTVQSEEIWREIATDSSFLFENVNKKHGIIAKRFPIMAEGVTPYLRLLEKHVLLDEGLLNLQLSRINHVKSNRQLLAQLSDRFSDAVDQLAGMNAKIEEIARDAIVSSDTIASRSAWINSFTIIVALAVGVGVAGLVIYGVRMPMKNLIRRMEKIANNDLKLEERSTATGEFRMISDSLDHLIENLVGVVKTLKTQSGSLTDIASDISSMSSDSLRDIVSQREQTQSLASAASEMEYAAKDSARHSGETNLVVARLHASAFDGRDIVKKSRDLVVSLDRELDVAVEVMSDLRDESTNIDSIVSVILNIAEQTNLLALNAAIEAARAGEKGRGFAVVADEVRTLATKTQHSSAEITHMVERLQSKSLEANNIMQKSKNTAKNCVEFADLTADTLESMLQGLVKIKEMMTGIASANDEQSETTAHVAKAIALISCASDEIYTRSQRMEESSEKLKRISNTQAQFSSKFRV